MWRIYFEKRIIKFKRFARTGLAGHASAQWLASSQTTQHGMARRFERDR